MTGRAWTQEELGVIRSAEKSGLTTREALFLLPGRTLGSLKKKLHTMGVTMDDRPDLRRSLPLSYSGEGKSRLDLAIATAGSTCCWPLNNRRPWIFCDKPVVGRQSYCEAHRAIAAASSQSEKSRG